MLLCDFTLPCIQLIPRPSFVSPQTARCFNEVKGESLSRADDTRCSLLASGAVVMTLASAFSEMGPIFQKSHGCVRNGHVSSSG